jgi:hypothetical protein
VKTFLVLLAVAVGLTFVEDLVAGPAEHHPWRVTFVLAALGLVVACAWFIAGSWAAPLLALLGAAGFSLVSGWDARDNYLTPYCSYGAKTQAELDSCLETVESEEIDALDTPAARFARGETTECGAGSGPFCAEAAGSAP